MMMMAGFSTQEYIVKFESSTGSEVQFYCDSIYWLITNIKSHSLMKT